MRMLALVVLAACTSPGTGSGLAKVEVSVFTNIADSTPIVGAPVAFVDPSGSGFVVHTGTDGIARGEVAEGGSVTALVGTRPSGNPPYLSSMLGVRDGDKVRLGFWSPSLDLPTGTPTCTDVDFTATFTNVATHGVAGLYFLRHVEGWNGEPIEIDQSITLPTTLRTIPGAPGGTSAELSIALTGPDNTQGMIGDWIDGCQPTYEVNLAEMVPWIDDITSAGRRIDVSRAGGTLEGDMMTTLVQYSTTNEPFVNWNVITPVVDSYELPTLPGELSFLNPTSPLTKLAVQLDDYELLDGYDDARFILGATNGLGQTGAPVGIGRLVRTYRIQL